MQQLRRDALRIWQAGVDAVRSDRLVHEALRVEAGTLLVGDEPLALEAIGRIVVVGAGKAGAGMAAAVEDVLGPRLMEQKQLAGWVNVPADCVRPLRRITLCAARPAGVNEPTPAGVAGAEQILQLVHSLGPADLCLCLISGGGSALLPAPAEGITLRDKLELTRHLSAAGANIEQLNAVRKQLSRIKGGGLARACRAGRLVSLVISDVLGDPLDVIASGPTVDDGAEGDSPIFVASCHKNWDSPQAALEVLDRFVPRDVRAFDTIYDYLRHKQQLPRPRPTCQVRNVIIGNNATAVDAAGSEAERLGYSHAMLSARSSEGAAEQVGRHLAEMALRMRAGPGSNCLVSGGEPVVTLVDAARRGLGGRNQQLVLAALQRLADDATGIALLSGGTDGEDGPTDAAGAILDAEIVSAARRQGLDPADYLARNDAYHFFAPLGALIKTGPTDTNVCDLRIVVVERR